jgi:hypothetical protein
MQHRVKSERDVDGTRRGEADRGVCDADGLLDRDRRDVQGHVDPLDALVVARLDGERAGSVVTELVGARQLGEGVLVLQRVVHGLGDEVAETERRAGTHTDQWQRLPELANRAQRLAESPRRR